MKQARQIKNNIQKKNHAIIIYIISIIIDLLGSNSPKSVLEPNNELLKYLTRVGATY